MPETFTTLGTITGDRLAELTGGLLTGPDVTVRINRHVAEADIALVVGPVFPHEVVGFSGGNKYFFPGVSGQELIDLPHWVGALITSADMIGTRGVTPVRALIDEGGGDDPDTAVGAVPGRRIRHRFPACHRLRQARRILGGLCGALGGYARHLPGHAGAAGAVDHADQVRGHLDRAAEGFYKLEPIVADGGEVIIYGAI